MSLKLEGLSVRFGGGSGLRGLYNLNLEVKSGEIYGLFGRNGCGKSSILRSISGTYRMERGSIEIGGTDVSFMAAHERARFLALIAQDTGVGLPEHMSLVEVLSMFQQAYVPWWSSPVRTERRGELIEAIVAVLPHMSSRLDDQVASLSGGERQLLSLACVRLMLSQRRNEAFALLLDEHVAALDPVTRRDVLGQTRRLVDEYGLACLMVSHDVEGTLQCADRIAILVNGSIQFEQLSHEVEHSFVLRAME